MIMEKERKNEDPQRSRDEAPADLVQIDTAHPGFVPRANGFRPPGFGATVAGGRGTVTRLGGLIRLRVR